MVSLVVDDRAPPDPFESRDALELRVEQLELQLQEMNRRVKLLMETNVALMRDYNARSATNADRGGK